MDKFVDERDYKLLGNDKYIFLVLKRLEKIGYILRGKLCTVGKTEIQ